MTQNKQMPTVHTTRSSESVLTEVSCDNRATLPSTPNHMIRWLTLSQLPGMFSAGIKAIGESIFLPLTSTPPDRIEVIACMANRGPHLQRDIDFTAHQLRHTVSPSRIFEYSAEQIGQLFGSGYQAQAVQLDEVDFTYLLVRDLMGSYIYRWPSHETKPRHPGLDLKKAGIPEKALGVISGTRANKFLR